MNVIGKLLLVVLTASTMSACAGTIMPEQGIIGSPLLGYSWRSGPGVEMTKVQAQHRAAGVNPGPYGEVVPNPAIGQAAPGSVFAADGETLLVQKHSGGGFFGGGGGFSRGRSRKVINNCNDLDQSTRDAIQDATSDCFNYGGGDRGVCYKAACCQIGGLCR